MKHLKQTLVISTLAGATALTGCVSSSSSSTAMPVRAAEITVTALPNLPALTVHVAEASRASGQSAAVTAALGELAQSRKPAPAAAVTVSLGGSSAQALRPVFVSPSAM